MTSVPTSLDLAAIERRFGPSQSADGAAFFSQMVSAFIDLSTKIVADLSATVTANDAPGVADQAHRLRGMSANLGAMELSELCAALEVCAKAGIVPREPGTMAQIQQVLTKSTAELEMLCRDLALGVD